RAGTPVNSIATIYTPAWARSILYSPSLIFDPNNCPLPVKRKIRPPGSGFPSRVMVPLTCAAASSARDRGPTDMRAIHASTAARSWQGVGTMIHLLDLGGTRPLRRVRAEILPDVPLHAVDLGEEAGRGHTVVRRVRLRPAEVGHLLLEPRDPFQRHLELLIVG